MKWHLFIVALFYVIVLACGATGPNATSEPVDYQKYIATVEALQTEVSKAMTINAR